MEEKAVVREVIYEWFEMEPARKRAGFFMGKLPVSHMDIDKNVNLATLLCVLW